MSQQVSVRMYNVGFGDCFLLTLPGEERPWRMLIDCGTHPSSTGTRSASDAAEQLIADLAEDGTAPHLDVIAATHRHRDHVSGFDSAELWAAVEVDQVWLPWTEDPKNPTARRLLERMSGIALALDSARALMPADSDVVSLAAALIENSLRNERPMATLHEGFAGTPGRRFLSAGYDTSELIPANVRIHVLGPSRDEKVIRTMDPPREETFMHLAEDQGPADEARPAFDPDWAISWDEFHQIEAFTNIRPGGQVIGAIRRVASEDLLYAAASLEKSVNGTSLVLAIEVGELVLLFPGDAQWGAWQAILENAEWRRLVGRARFYKIGHHGSHNATPRSFVDDVLASDIWAALPFAPVKIWPKIPHQALMTALLDKQVKVLRSDTPPEVGAYPEVRVNGEISIELGFDVG